MVKVYIHLILWKLNKIDIYINFVDGESQKTDLNFVNWITKLYKNVM